MKRILISFVLTAVSIVWICFFISLNNTVVDVQSQDTQDQWSQTELPWHFEREAANQHLRVTLKNAWFVGTCWRVVPDDDLREILINGVSAQLDTLSPGATRDWGKGFIL
ncbi:MAG TPA: hypothetical protein VLM37_09095, partial [Fibrobacteraceae bacterium]|nr:hypothetical protein [Fibrobacteraceae bacterium]